MFLWNITTIKLVLKESVISQKRFDDKTAKIKKTE